MARTHSTLLFPLGPLPWEAPSVQAAAMEVAQRGERACAGVGRHDLYIVMTKQGCDAHLLRRVVLDNQQESQTRC